MRNAVVFVGSLLLIGGCQFGSGLDEDPVEYADPVMISLDDARIGLQATTTGTASTATRAPGLSAEDAADSLTFRSSDIEFWGIETIDDIDNIYSTTAIRDDRADVNTEIINVSVQADLGDLHWTFSPNVTDLHFGAGTVVEFPQVVNLIRIDIGAGIMFIEDDGVEIDELYDANGNLMRVVDGQYVMADRTGNGVCLDFNVGLSATEETQPSD